MRLRLQRLIVLMMPLPLLVYSLSTQAGSKKKNKPTGALIQKQQGDLQKLENEIQKKEKRVNSLRQRESSIVAMLDQLDRQLDSGKERRSKLIQNRQQVELEIQQNGSDINQLQLRSSQLQDDITYRLRTLYKLGDIGYMRLFLGLHDLRDLATAGHMVRRVVSKDLLAMNDFQQQQKNLADHRDQLRFNQQRLQEIIANLELEAQQTSEQKKRQKQLLSMTRNQRETYLHSIEELKTAANNLQQLIDKLVLTGYDSNFAMMQGFLSLPVVAPITGRFGKYLDPKFKTPLNRNGIEIRAKDGQQVLAVYNGKVIYSGWFTGYGKIVIIDHGDNYYSMSAHLDKIAKAVGETVDTGELIGRVGETGSLAGPQLYFELRHRGQAIDPLPWFSRKQLKN
jgi:septal ring factor EnvC (AmiA/AmiB activator)